MEQMSRLVDCIKYDDESSVNDGIVLWAENYLNETSAGREIYEILKDAEFSVDEEVMDRMMYRFMSKVIGMKEKSKYAMSMFLHRWRWDLAKKESCISLAFL